ncbi:hypothetical protein [Methanocella sp. MCL-LM]|uniref:hypothetical protein n=1 Tax=Methanocella sp. MCL-LM TaxID=3412035 RepID=UPI003C786084
MIKHKLILISLAILAILSLSMQVAAQVPGAIPGSRWPVPDYFSVPEGCGLMPGIGSWGGFSIFGPWGIYDQYGLFGPHGLFGPSGPGYGNGLGFGGFGMHDPLALVKLNVQGVKV